MNLSHDGLPLGCVERSSHLEEYSRSRPASAGSRPRSLLNKMASAAAAAQQDDEPEPVDAEPWVLEGWGDGPSVSEAAQQAALRLGPYNKNVPTTLVGLGGPGGRRVLSAGHQGRSPLKVSEARRRPGGGLGQAQGERRASGPVAVGHGGQASAVTARRIILQRNLEVGDESDVEPTSYPSSATAAASHVQQAMQGSSTPFRALPGQRAGPPSPMRHYHSSAAQQTAQSAPATGPRGRRDNATAGSTAGAASTTAHTIPATANAWAATAVDTSPRPPRSISADAYHPSGPGTGGAAGSRLPQGAGRTAPAAHGPGAVQYPAAGIPSVHPHLPSQQASGLSQPLPGHREPLNPLPSRIGSGRGGPGVSESGTVLVERPGGSFTGNPDAQPPPLRSSSFSSPATTTQQHSLSNQPFDPLHAPSTPTHNASPPPYSLGGPSSGLTAPPPLPGLFPTGRRMPPVRVDAGLSGWDPEAPSIQAQQPQSLWVGPTPLGTSGLVIGPASCGRGSPLQGGHAQHRRDQLGSNSRLQRAQGGPSAGILDLSLGPSERPPERTSHNGGPASAGLSRIGSRGQAIGGPLQHVAGGSRSGSPDGPKPPGFPAPQQDALTEFCASRAELGSAGAAPGGSGGAPTLEQHGRAGSASGMLAPLSVPVPMRVTPLAKMPTAVGRVS